MAKVEGPLPRPTVYYEALMRRALPTQIVRGAIMAPRHTRVE